MHTCRIQRAWDETVPSYPWQPQSSVDPSASPPRCISQVWRIGSISGLHVPSKMDVDQRALMQVRRLELDILMLPLAPFVEHGDHVFGSASLSAAPTGFAPPLPLYGSMSNALLLSRQGSSVVTVFHSRLGRHVQARACDYSPTSSHTDRVSLLM
jgi:hypothetical protein